MLMGDKTPVDESHGCSTASSTPAARSSTRPTRTAAASPSACSRRGSPGGATTSCSRRRCASRPTTRRAKGCRPTASAPACDASLRRLGVDVIDLYQVHAPDPDVPLEETLEALDGLVRAGKVRALGASNFPAWLLAWAVALQDRHGWSPFVSLQAQYSLVERSVEIEALPFMPRRRPRRPAVGAARRRVPDRPLPPRRGDARGQPDGDRGRRPRGGARAARDRAQLPRRSTPPRRSPPTRGATVPQVAIAWLRDVEGVTAPIVGPRTIAQLEDLLGERGSRADRRGARAARGAGAAAGHVPAADARASRSGSTG